MPVLRSSTRKRKCTDSMSSITGDMEHVSIAESGTESGSSTVASRRTSGRFNRSTGAKVALPKRTRSTVPVKRKAGRVKAKAPPVRIGKKLKADGNALPGREIEFDQISTKLGSALNSSQGLCLCMILDLVKFNTNST